MTPTEVILEASKECGSIDAIRKKTKYSWQKIAKTLSSEGIITNETQAIILSLYEKGREPKEIADQTGFALSTVMAYIPRKRPTYNENLSRNAKNIKRWREKRK